MPEGPELAASKDAIISKVKNASMINFHICDSSRYNKKMPVGFTEFASELKLNSPTIRDIKVKGKFMWWELAFPNQKTHWYMWVTYGMSGFWSQKKSKHSSFFIEAKTLDSNLVSLYFDDQRRFGTLHFINDESKHIKKINSLGPCVISEKITYETFSKRICKKPNKPIAEVLLDQSCLSGVGNYLRAEILYSSRINPWRRVSSLTRDELEAILFNTTFIAKKSYDSQGASIKNYHLPDGNNGAAQFYFNVYGRSTDHQGNNVIREKDSNGRTIHWCPSVQQ